MKEIYCLPIFAILAHAQSSFRLKRAYSDYLAVSKSYVVVARSRWPGQRRKSFSVLDSRLILVRTLFFEERVLSQRKRKPFPPFD